MEIKIRCYLLLLCFLFSYIYAAAPNTETNGSSKSEDDSDFSSTDTSWKKVSKSVIPSDISAIDGKRVGYQKRQGVNMYFHNRAFGQVKNAFLDFILENRTIEVINEYIDDYSDSGSFVGFNYKWAVKNIRIEHVGAPEDAKFEITKEGILIYLKKVPLKISLDVIFNSMVELEGSLVAYSNGIDLEVVVQPFLKDSFDEETQQQRRDLSVTLGERRFQFVEPLEFQIPQLNVHKQRAPFIQWLLKKGWDVGLSGPLKSVLHYLIEKGTFLAVNNKMPQFIVSGTRFVGTNVFSLLDDFLRYSYGIELNLLEQFHFEDQQLAITENGLLRLGFDIYFDYQYDQFLDEDAEMKHWFFSRPPQKWPDEPDQRKRMTLFGDGYVEHLNQKSKMRRDAENGWKCFGEKCGFIRNKDKKQNERDHWWVRFKRKWKEFWKGMVHKKKA